MEALGIDPKLLIAQAINFVILLLVLRKFLYTPIVKMLSERKERIEKGIKDAELATKALEEASSQSKKILGEATKESNKIIASAKKQIELETQRQLSSAKDSAQEIVQKAKQQAKLEQERIVSSAKKEIADLVVAVSEKIISEKTDKSDINKAIEKIK